MKTNTNILGLLLLTILLCFESCMKVEDLYVDKPGLNSSPNSPTIAIDSIIIANGLSFTAEESEEYLTFTTNTDWTLIVAKAQETDWCTPSVTSGKEGTNTIKFFIKENTGYDNRRVTVTIKAGSASKTFIISQKQKDALLVTTDTYEVKPTGGNIKVEVKANIDYQIEIAEDAKSWISENITRALKSKTHIFAIATSE